MSIYDTQRDRTIYWTAGMPSSDFFANCMARLTGQSVANKLNKMVTIVVYTQSNAWISTG